MKIGFLINPIAGVGAKLAWKGTDNITKAWEEVEKGAEQPAFNIAKKAIESINFGSRYEWYLCSDMDNLITGDIIYKFQKHSTKNDTINAMKVLLNLKIDLVLFVGGDGTAKDIASILKDKIPFLGIPAGVKMFSPCFLHRPDDLGSFLEKWNGSTKIVDIYDLDEEEYKKGLAIPKLVGYGRVPNTKIIQYSKISYFEADNSIYESFSQRILDEKLLDSKLILVGTGTTLYKIFQFLNIEISLLGVDIVKDGVVIKSDCTEKDLSEFDFDEIWITPIGHQGHIFGRGNKQISPKIIKQVGKGNIRIFSTKEKLNHTPFFYVDTGLNDLDIELKGYYKVITGYHEETLRKVI